MSVSKGKLGVCVEEGWICLNLTISNPKFVYLELTDLTGRVYCFAYCLLVCMLDDRKQKVFW